MTSFRLMLQQRFSAIWMPLLVMTGNLGQFQLTSCFQGRFSNISESNAYSPQNRWSVLYLAEKRKGRKKRDRLGRFYAYYQEDELESLLLQAGFTPEHTRRGALRGMAGNIEDWFGVLSWKER